MILEKELILIGSKGGRRCLALFDSGASYSVIKPEIAEEIESLSPLPDPEGWVFETARKGEFLRAIYRVGLDFHFDDSEARFSDEFIVLEGCSEEVIIGATTMQKWGIKLDFEAEEIRYRKTAERLRLV